METNSFSETAHLDDDGSYDARQALADAASARDHVATRASAPWYYYPALGLSVGVLILGAALGNTVESLIASLASVILSVTLMNLYRRKTGMWITLAQTQGLARAVWITYGIALVGLVMVAVIWRGELSTAAGWSMAAAAFVLTLITGAIMEPALRRSLRDGTTATGSAR